MKEVDLSVIYVGKAAAVAGELRRLSELVGVDFETGAGGTAVLTFSDGPQAGTVEARFHPMFAAHFPTGKVQLDVREDAAEILELLTAVASTVRGIVVAVVGAHGGAGTSTLAAWIARLLAQGEGKSAGLVDLDPASAGLDQLLAIDAEPGKRWADLTGGGSILAGRLNQVLPEWHSVRVVSADERAPVADVDSALQVISALSQVQPWTVLDLGPIATVPSAPEYAYLEWCDDVLVVTSSDAVSLAHARTALRRIGGRYDVVARSHSKSESAHIAQFVGADKVWPVRETRTMRGDLDHGVAPGDRARSGMGRDVKAIVDALRGRLA